PMPRRPQSLHCRQGGSYSRDPRLRATVAVRRESVIALTSSLLSLLSEGSDRIDARSTPRWYDSRDESDRAEDQRRTNEGNGVGRGHAEKHVLEDASYAKRSEQTEHGPNDRQTRALRDNEPDHLRWRCAKRHTDADLLHAPFDGIGQHAVNPHRSEHECRQGEDRHGRRPELR